MSYPTDDKIKETFLKVSEDYAKGDNWAIRLTAEELSCPISYVRSVLEMLDSKGEL